MGRDSNQSMHILDFVREQLELRFPKFTYRTLRPVALPNASSTILRNDYHIPSVLSSRGNTTYQSSSPSRIQHLSSPYHQDGPSKHISVKGSMYFLEAFRVTRRVHLIHTPGLLFKFNHREHTHTCRYAAYRHRRRSLHTPDKPSNLNVECRPPFNR